MPPCFSNSSSLNLVVNCLQQFPDLLHTEPLCIVSGGIGESISALLSGSDASVINLGWPDRFIEHGTQQQLYAKYGLDGEGIAACIEKRLKRK